jgi:hypothetical protein
MATMFSKLISASLTGLLCAAASYAQSPATQEGAKSLDKREVHLIYFGGPDCPPCVAWRQDELPKLEKTQAFKSIKFSYVRKTIGSPIPSSFFLPDEVKPYKDKLHYASNGRGGSPQAALMVNGEVYHYLISVHSAEQYAQMILAAQNGTKFPAERCIRRANNRECLEVAN